MASATMRTARSRSSCWYLFWAGCSDAMGSMLLPSYGASADPGAVQDHLLSLGGRDGPVVALRGNAEQALRPVGRSYLHAAAVPPTRGRGGEGSVTDQAG